MLRGDYSKARQKLQWAPKTKFPDLVRLMVEADMKLLADQLAGKVKRQD